MIANNRERQKIDFLIHPLRKVINLSDITNKQRILRDITNQTGIGGYIYRRYTDKNEFTPSMPFQNLKYDEVMFVQKGGYIYVAPNSGENIKLSHPSLLGGYPYEVDDAGVLCMENGIVTAYNDSGHYGKYDKSKNVEMTNKLNPQITKKKVVKPKIVIPVLSNSTT